MSRPRSNVVKKVFNFRVASQYNDLPIDFKSSSISCFKRKYVNILVYNNVLCIQLCVYTNICSFILVSGGDVNGPLATCFQ
jgi:hypothetical protein